MLEIYPGLRKTEIILTHNDVCGKICLMLFFRRPIVFKFKMAIKWRLSYEKPCCYVKDFQWNG